MKLRLAMEVEIKARDFFTYAEGDKDPALCAVEGCENHRRKTGGGRVCCKCTQRLWRARYPVRAAWAALRDHARRRRVDFSLTPQQFAALISGTPYLDTRGNAAGGYHVDRIDAMLGYEVGNVCVIPMEENCRKGCSERYSQRTWRHRAERMARERELDPREWDEAELAARYPGAVAEGEDPF